MNKKLIVLFIIPNYPKLAADTLTNFFKILLVKKIYYFWFVKKRLQILGFVGI